MTPTYDSVLVNGRVIDPHADTVVPGDVAILAGRIAAVGTDIDPGGARVVDARGAYVSPGFTDIHGHYFAHGFPIAIEPDRVGVDVGVTTVVDAGSTGWANFPAFRELEMRRSRTRVLAFLHICGIGLQPLAAGVGELSDLRYADVERTVKCAEEHPGEIVGIKVRLTSSVPAPPLEILRRAIEAAAATGLPVMAHITDPPAPMPDVYDLLRPGDVVTHAFHGGPAGILTAAGRLHPWVADARDRGVLFDVGHAGTLFSTDVARRAADAGLWPDTISTDAYRPDDGAVVPDLPGLVSEFLALGMPLGRAVAAVTTTCARILGRPWWQEPWAVGTPADITVFELVDGRVQVTEVLRGGARHTPKEKM
ncbi:amidohydrolase family protein [Actinophytocola xanthii]|uniref:Dihydroorotase n=1 Tax=Actinophytocola xanthii TaxID=1912961 RepID=A0A1Q8CK05_9PSEU|nr:hypothetical protein [Actinophytocola xanthii]OLF14684.1 hypothetical protein BU204_25675 [Actinophytocola xanthii]